MHVTPGTRPPLTAHMITDHVRLTASQAAAAGGNTSHLLGRDLLLEIDNILMLPLMLNSTFSKADA